MNLRDIIKARRMSISQRMRRSLTQHSLSVWEISNCWFRMCLSSLTFFSTRSIPKKSKMRQEFHHKMLVWTLDSYRVTRCSPSQTCYTCHKLTKSLSLHLVNSCLESATSAISKTMRRIRRIGHSSCISCHLLLTATWVSSTIRCWTPSCHFQTLV